MAGALDHLVLSTQDLAVLAGRFARLGFTVGRQNRHPWGTLNHIIQFSDRSFLELIGFAPDYADLGPAEPAYPFAGFLKRSLADGRSGVTMAVLRSADAGADAARFQTVGIGEGRLLPFSRAAQGPDGSDRTVAFTVAFAEARTMPEIGFFTCQQHRPENFWNPATQVHVNGVTGLSGLVIVAENPSDHAEFLAHFTGQREMLATSMGLDIELDGSRIEVLTPVAYGFRYGAESLRATGAPTIAAVRFSVADRPATAAYLQTAGCRFAARRDTLMLGPDEGPGCALVFSERE